MKTIEYEARVKNVSGRPRARCRWCDSTGYVVYDAGDPDPGPEWRQKVRRMTLEQKQEQGLTRDVYGEMMAPCPYCERGFFEEFPKQDRDLSIKSPWGEEGFWFDKPDVKLVPMMDTTNYLPMEENKRRLAELGARFGVIGKSPPPEDEEAGSDDDIPF